MYARVTWSYDRIAVVISKGFHIEPCCGDMHAHEQHVLHMVHNEQQHYEPKARSCTVHFHSSTSHSFDDGLERVWAVRSCYSKTMVGNCEPTLETTLLCECEREKVENS